MHYLRLRNWEWWSTTALVWLKTSKRYLSPTGWWVISTAPSQTLGPPNMTLPSTKNIPCCWRLIMFQAKSTLQWVHSLSLPHSVLSEGPDHKTSSIWIKPERIKECVYCHKTMTGYFFSHLMTISSQFHSSQPSLPCNVMSVLCLSQASPPSFCPASRTQDLDSILSVISGAQHYIDVAVMEYFPTTRFIHPQR